jgi:hypothetical protein
MSLRRAQEAADVARDDFATVSQRVLREVDRFKREKAEDMRRTVLDYINLQVDYNKRMEEVWGTLIPQLERVQLDSNSNAIPVTPEQQQQYAASGVAGMSTQPPMMQQQQQPPFNSDEPMPSAPSPPVPTPTTVPVVGDPSSMISVQYRE